MLGRLVEWAKSAWEKLWSGYEQDPAYPMTREELALMDTEAQEKRAAEWLKSNNE